MPTNFYFFTPISPRQKKWITVFVILLFATYFRIYGVGVESLWYDEIYTWWCAHLPWKDMFSALQNPGGELPLYYVGIKLMISIFNNDNEITLRFLSAIFGIVGVLLALKLGSIVGGSVGMLAAGWFWAIHPMAIWYARDVKTYSLTSMLAAAVLISYLLLWRNNSKINWIIATVFLTFGMLTHYFFFVFSIILLGVSLFKFNDPSHFFRKWMIISIIAYIPLAAWLYWYFSQPSPVLASGWIPKPELVDPLLTIWNLVSGYAGKNSFPTSIFGIFTIIIIIVGIIYRDSKKTPILLLIFCTITIILGVWVISQFRPLYVDRYFIILFPITTLLFAYGFSHLWKLIKNSHHFTNRHNLIQIGIFSLFLLLGITTAYHTITDPLYKKENWKGLVNEIINSGQENPNIWFSDIDSIRAFNYYFKREFIPIISFENSLCKPDCWWVLRQPFTYQHAFSQSINPSNRKWIPDLPANCDILNSVDYKTGIMLWKVSCY